MGPTLPQDQTHRDLSGISTLCDEAPATGDRHISPAEYLWLADTAFFALVVRDEAGSACLQELPKGFSDDLRGRRPGGLRTFG